MISTPTNEPFELFARWFADASAAEIADPDAVALATATPEGMPSVRMVLLKGWDETGFVFFTNLGSRKSGELRNNPRASLCLYWKSIKRQVRIEGDVAQVSDDEADTYFASRPRVSQIGAWASKQSQPLNGRLELERRVAAITARYAIGSVPRPEFWSGFRVDPRSIEFWEDQPFRLHKRHVYTRLGDGWQKQELYP